MDQSQLVTNKNYRLGRKTGARALHNGLFNEKHRDRARQFIGALQHELYGEDCHDCEEIKSFVAGVKAALTRED